MPQLSLTSEFQFLIGERSVAVPHGVQRLLAFLAVAGCPVPRSRVAGQLWLDVTEQRALGNLRSALWRLKGIPRAVVRTLDERLMLHPDIRVDVDELTDLSDRMLHSPDAAVLGGVLRLVAAGDILPSWEDEWLIVERERFRELRLRALERAGEALMTAGDYAAAARVGLAAVAAEPFRESAQRLLVRVHLSEGNRAAALRSYRTYRRLIGRELGIEPSELMTRLVANLPCSAPESATRQ